MNPIEAKIIRSFKELKSDIIQLQNEYMEISGKQDEMIRDFGDVRESIEKKTDKKPKVKAKKKSSVKAAKIAAKKKSPIKVEDTEIKTKVVSPKKANLYVSGSTGKSFHVEECRFAQRIKPEAKKIFNSKDEAINAGLKPCNCVK